MAWRLTRHVLLIWLFTYIDVSHCGCGLASPLLRSQKMSDHHHHPKDHMVFDDSKAEEYVKEVFSLSAPSILLTVLQQIVQSNAEHVVSCVKRYLKPGSDILGDEATCDGASS